MFKTVTPESVGISSEKVLDFYKFLIELSNKEWENELKTYRAYYVPAVAEKYISNMPVWDGNFNWNH